MSDKKQSRVADAIIEMADANHELHDDAKLLVIAALEDEAQLAAALEDAYAPPPRPIAGPAAAEPAPAGAFVKSIRVQGFRGIGPIATLDLHPAPGLTVVAGRNGSGKSSFSEALELALTGDTYRWNSKRNPKMWKEHWRNLHHPVQCEIRVELAEEGSGSTTIGVDWADGADLSERTSWVQRNGSRREPGIDSLGWRRAVELYQPILSYDELGGLLEAEPSKLFDKLGGILGLEQATDAQVRLGEALSALEQPEKQLKTLTRDLKRDLQFEDERAAQALEELRKPRPNIDAVEAVAVGTLPDTTSDVAKLRALVDVVLPAGMEVAEAAAAIRSAIRRIEELSGTALDAATRRANLLREALAFHDEHGDSRCPVCGEGTLDMSWHARIQQELAHDEEESRAHRQAQHALQQARHQAEALLRSIPRPEQPGRFILGSLARAQAAHSRWIQAPDGSAALADHLEAEYQSLLEAFTPLREEAENVLQAQDSVWRPHAVRLVSWAALARTARERETKLSLVRDAHTFMKVAVEKLRDRELAKLTDTAHQVWAALKAESNVDLGAIKLTGSNTRRRVEVQAAVDSEDAQALSVMSQGELHALALALFLPRATVPGSPFRFVVLDDPVQAMDPAKVDGFVRVLTKLAEERQVVVFSHDDRLPQTVRQLGINARVLEVRRDANSTVHVEPCLEPARRFLGDAFALAKDPAVEAAIKVRVLPGLCRMAVEAAARDVYMARRFSSGASRADVEETWQNTTLTGHRLALAVLDDKQGDLTPWLNAKPWRRPARKIATSGVHNGLSSAPINAVQLVERLVTDGSAQGLVDTSRVRLRPRLEGCHRAQALPP
ncbi:ATP-binding protein [Amycolatopsis methanolica]|uniref:ATP-binding protein n=1 Tax=Amycolatopsis methanolica TaxID=1814 RepID=UPI003427FC04